MYPSDTPPPDTHPLAVSALGGWAPGVPASGIAAHDRPADGGARDLAPTQLAILAAEIWAAEPHAYTVVSAVSAHGLPDWTAFIAAVRSTLQRHDVMSWHVDLDTRLRLRASRPSDEGDVRLESSAPSGVALRELDLRSLSRSEADKSIRDLMESERSRAINVFAGSSYPLTRVTAARMPSPNPPAEHVTPDLLATADAGQAVACILSTHHILVDEQSLSLLWREIFTRAASAVNAGTGHNGAVDDRFAHWATSMSTPAWRLRSQAAAAQVIQSISPAGVSPLASSYATPVSDPRQHRFTLSRVTADDLGRRSAAFGVSPNAILGAAFVRSVSRALGVSSFLMHFPISCRTLDFDVVGCYVSGIPVLAQATGGSFEQDLHHWQKAVAFSTEHAIADADAVAAAVGVPDVSLAFENPGLQHRAGSVLWKLLSPPTGVAKHAVSAYLSCGAARPPHRTQPGGRLLWKPGSLDLPTAGHLIDALDQELSGAP